MLSDLVPSFPPLALYLGVFLCVVLIALRARRRLPDIPIIGSRKGDWFPLLQAKWRNSRDFKAAMEEAYSQYRVRAVLMPIASAGDIVVLPRSQVEFLMEQPDSVLGFNERAFDMYQIDYTFVDPSVPRATLHESLLRTALTPRIHLLIPVLADEVEWAFAKHWGTDTSQWRELPVYESMRHIVGGVANRAFVGLPFCRDPELVNNGMGFAIDIPLSGAAIKFLWPPLRPLLAPLITIPNRIHTRRFRNILMGEIKRRLGDFEKRRANPNDKSLGPEPVDLLQWSIEQAKSQKEANPYLWRPETLADRLLIVNFAAIHTTSFTTTWATFDLIATLSDKPGVVDELRAEIESVLAANDGRWTKKALAQLTKLDSALRESARLSSILTIGLNRVVVAEQGLTTPSGVHLPKGTPVSVPVYPVMRDDAVYPDAAEYMPFRFCNKEQQQGTDGGGAAAATTVTPLTTTDTDFLVFGHGKHACPGRYFAAAELKIILAYALLHYDFEVMPVKPEGPWYGVTRLPPLTSSIRVRRREYRAPQGTGTSHM